MRTSQPSKRQAQHGTALKLRLLHLAQSGLCEVVEPDEYRSDLLTLVQKVSGSRGLTSKADFFKALSDQIRLQIIYSLMEREMCECELMAALNMSQPSISHHLSILQRSQIIAREKRGKWAFYRIVNPSVKRRLEDILA